MELNGNPWVIVRSNLLKTAGVISKKLLTIFWRDSWTKKSEATSFDISGGVSR